MRKLKALALASVLLAVGVAHACGLIFPTTVPGIVWQDCYGEVAVGNQGPSFVTVDFSVVYATGGIPGHWVATIAPRSFVAEPTAGPVASVVVNGIQVQ